MGTGRNTARPSTSSQTNKRVTSPDQQIYQLSEYRALKMNIIIAGAFCVAWIPYSILQIVLLSGTDMSQPLVFIIQWLAFANSFWNSIIYYYVNREYRKHALKLYSRLLHFGCQRSQCRGESNDIEM